MPLLETARIGFSTASLAGCSLSDALRIGSEMGFQACELLAFDAYRHSQGVLGGFYFEHMSAAEKDELLELCAPYRRITTHAPFIDIASLAPNPSIREAAQRQLEIAIEAVAFLGGHNTTTHISPKHIYPLAEYKAEIVELYRRLGDLAGDRGVTVSVETGYPAGVEPFADVVWSIDHPAVGVTVDVGHLVSAMPTELRGTAEGVTQYGDFLEAHLRSLKGRIVLFHMHDIRFSDFRDHRAVGRGFLDYARILATASEIGYEGDFVFELEEPDTETALLESRDVLAAVEW